MFEYTLSGDVVMKTNIRVLSLALVIVFAVGSVSQAIGTGWMDNFEKAKAKAAAEDKDLLVDFTGSDWCGWCIRLNKEVFDKDIFKTQAPKEFVLVALDYPRDKTLVSEETTKQNTQLKNEYAIRGYPTIYLMDESGRPYAKTGYQAGGPDVYMTHLAELKRKHQERDDSFAAAKKAGTDLAKAKSVDKAMEAMGIELAIQFYAAEIDQIIALDADNKAGLKNKYEQRAFDQEIKTLLGQGKMDEAAQILEEKLKLWSLPQAEMVAMKTKYEQQIFDAKVGGMMRAKKYDEAIELIQARITTEKPKGQALVALELTRVGAYRMKGETETAIKMVDTLIETHQLTGAALQDALSAKALVYQASRDTENMTKVLILAIKAAPDTSTGKGMQGYLDRMKETPKR
jgi:thioredoxin-related protein